MKNEYTNYMHQNLQDLVEIEIIDGIVFDELRRDNYKTIPAAQCFYFSQ